MNARPNAWLRQAENDLALAQLARDNGFLAQACWRRLSRQPIRPQNVARVAQRQR